MHWTASSRRPLHSESFTLRVISNYSWQFNLSFGALGYHVIFNAIAEKFPQVTVTLSHQLLAWEALIEQVLVPEAMVILISNDLHIEHDDAVETLQASTEFGLHYHSDPLDRQRSSNGTIGEPIISMPLPPPSPVPASHNHIILPTTPNVSDAAAHFPLPSPLLAPHALSPLLAPASWDPDPDLDLKPISIDPNSLCNYCDEELPFVKSTQLLAMAEKLFKLSWSDSLAENSLHRRFPHIKRTLEYCLRRLL